MLTYNLDSRGRLARYDYLYRCIKEDILSGRLVPGEKMPSKRALARHLETAVVTVENAYAQLLAEGYLVSEEKRGYYVGAVEQVSCMGMERSGENTEIEEKAGKKGWLLDLKSGGAATDGFPFSVWARLMRKVLSDQGEQLLRPIPHNGVYELRRAIARHLYQFQSIIVQPEQIVVGAGTEYLYNLIVQLLGRDAVYGLEDPGYSKAAKVYHLNNVCYEYLPLDLKGIIPEQVRAKNIQVLHISPNHQFPTGAVMPVGRRQSLLRWAGEGEERYIIEDDYDSEFRFTGRPIPSISSIGGEDRVIYMNTFSRSLAPSLRISYMVLPQSLLARYKERLGFYSCTVPAIEQYTLARFLEDGHFESHVNRMRVYYRNRRDAVIAAVEKSDINNCCSVIGAEAGLHFLLKLNTEKSDQSLFEHAEAQGIRLSFLSEYQKLNREDTHTLVVNYPGVDLEHLECALKVLGELL